MRRRQVLTGLAALGVAAVGDAGLQPSLPQAQGQTAPAGRSAWPAQGDGNARVEVTFRVHTTERAVALTFDDGPDPRWTPRVLDLLAGNGARATFFVVGERARRHPALLRRVAAAGHAIGNHTYRHADLTRITAGQAITELSRTSDVLAEVVGHRPTLFRPPYGHLDPVGLLAAAEAGLSVVLWSQLLRGSAPAADLEVCRREVRPGSIVLAHDGGPTPNATLLQALSGLIGGLQADGYALVDLPTLLRSAAAR